MFAYCSCQPPMRLVTISGAAASSCAGWGVAIEAAPPSSREHCCGQAGAPPPKPFPSYGPLTRTPGPHFLCTHYNALRFEFIEILVRIAMAVVPFWSSVNRSSC